MGQKGHIMVQKGLKRHEKKAKNRVFGPKKPAFLTEFSLTENHPAQKPLAEMRGTHPPLMKKNPLSSF